MIIERLPDVLDPVRAGIDRRSKMFRLIHKSTDCLMLIEEPLFICLTENSVEEPFLIVEMV